MTNAIKELILKMADDALIFGHRNSEWTGIGPTLEEDIAFSSMAQDKIGHAWALYGILNQHLGDKEPDTLAFDRKASDYKCCQMVTFFTWDYAFALVRHFLFDHAEYLRYSSLANSSYQPLAQLAKKITGEIKYHILHADTWMQSLANGSEESQARLQSALNEVFPLAAGIFEKGPFENKLIEQGIFIGEEALRNNWIEKTKDLIQSMGLQIPDIEQNSEAPGGRYGHHSEFLQPLLDEMSEVFLSEPGASW